MDGMKKTRLTDRQTDRQTDGWTGMQANTENRLLHTGSRHMEKHWDICRQSDQDLLQRKFWLGK